MPRPGALAVRQAVEQSVPDKAVLARQLPIDMELPAEDVSQARRRKHRLKVRRVAARSLATALVLVLTLGGVLFSQSYFKLSNVFKGGAGTAAALQENVKPELLKGEGRGRVNILLLGRGGGNHEAPDLTDTIMVASVDPVNKTTTLLSLPRDLWVNVPGEGVMKINAAWQSGQESYIGGSRAKANNPKAIQAGFKTLDETIKEVLGLEIDYHVLVNFQAFKQAIDTVNGVTVNVPADLVDPTMAWENANNPVLAKAGLQTFDGYRALMYARSRETSSDFARGERQRALLLALKTKVVSLGTLSNPLKISKLVNAFGNNVQTDLSVSNANRLYGLMKGVKDSQVSSIGLADEINPLVTTGNVAGQSVVLPKAGLYKYAEIQQFLRGQLKDPYIMREKAKILILNGTNIEGLAGTKAEELKTYGYNVVATANAPSNGWTRTTLVDLTRKKKYTRNYLEQRFGQYAAGSLGDTSIATQGADFVIILGSDEASNPQT